MQLFPFEGIQLKMCFQRDARCLGLVYCFSFWYKPEGSVSYPVNCDSDVGLGRHVIFMWYSSLEEKTTSLFGVNVLHLPS